MGLTPEEQAQLDALLAKAQSDDEPAAEVAADVADAVAEAVAGAVVAAVDAVDDDDQAVVVEPVDFAVADAVREDAYTEGYVERTEADAAAQVAVIEAQAAADVAVIEAIADAADETSPDAGTEAPPSDDAGVDVGDAGAEREGGVFDGDVEQPPRAGHWWWDRKLFGGRG